MVAIVTTGHGGFDRLQPRRVPVPRPDEDAVLLRVLAAGVNNTDINTRLGWYAERVTTATAAAAEGASADGVDPPSDGGWNRPVPFPLIQGTDCCGRVVAAGGAAGRALVGKRVLVRACMRPAGFENPEMVWMASDFDGAFAQFVSVPAAEVFPVDCAWSDAELATIPCAYGTAETMLHRARVGPGDRVLVTGASGGVGSATVQLARRRGARVLAFAARAKQAAVADLGAEQILDRGADPVALLGARAIDVVIDTVAGDGFPALLKTLNPGGRYAAAGAIAGPMVTLDMRDLYLKDLTLYGSTGWDETVFPNLIGYIERGEIRPLLAQTYPMTEIVAAQQAFLKRAHVGNIVLIPPPLGPPLG